MLMRRMFNRLLRLRTDCSGLAAVEMALATPLLLTLFLGGTEMVHNIVARKRVSELAMMVADNASRMGSDSVLNNKPISEAEVNEVFLGAQIQAGTLDLQANGRVVLYSLEQNTDGGQWVHWSRCYGNATFSPTYTAGTGASGNGFPGMGPSTSRITASSGDAVMYVEVVYDYVPVVPVSWAGYTTRRFTSTAAVNVRDNRDLTGIQNPAPVATIATCS